MNISGKVEDISAREVNGKFGPSVAYDVVIGGKKYGHGFKKPDFEIGDDVSFDVSVKQNGKYTNYDIDYASVRAGIQAAAKSVAQSTETDGYDRNRSIVRQNSLSHATNLVTAIGVTDLNKGIEAIIATAKRFEAYSMQEEKPFDDVL